MHSELLKVFLESCSGDSIPLDLDAVSLQLVASFLRLYERNPCPSIPKPIPWPMRLFEVVPEDYAIFMVVELRDSELFYKVFKAAEYLMIDPLIELCMARLARMMMGE